MLSINGLSVARCFDVSIEDLLPILQRPLLPSAIFARQHADLPAEDLCEVTRARIAHLQPHIDDGAHRLTQEASRAFHAHAREVLARREDPVAPYRPRQKRGALTRLP